MSSTTPPGWYPDNLGNGQRYWDGRNWTEHTAPAAVPPPAFGQPAYMGATPLGQAAVSTQPNWFLRHKIFTGVLAFVLLMVIVGAVGGGEPDPSPVSSDTASKSPLVDGTESDATVEQEGAEELEPSPSPEPDPSEQDKFMEIVAAGQEAAESGNEIQVVQAGKVRGKQICALLGPSLEVRDWSGTVEVVETELGGDKGVLSIDVGDGVAIGTWNNSLSDIGSNTLISTESKLFAVLANVSEGDDVTFSGRFIKESGGDCVEEQSLMDVNGMATPDFSFRFVSVKAD